MSKKEANPVFATCGKKSGSGELSPSPLKVKRLSPK
jgi:hypothetical protein